MLDISLLRDNPEDVKKIVAAKGYDPNLVEEFREADVKSRGFLRNGVTIQRPGHLCESAGFVGVNSAA
jgi:seryl-tRNA synthetase